MLKPLHLLTAAFFVLHFSGVPKSASITAAAVKEKPVFAAVKEKEDDDIIPWQEDRPLTWDDFLCEPRRNTDAVASTSTTLGIAYQVTSRGFVYDISCHFSKTKSWGLLRTSYILAHEQGHFDITEIFARQLHRALRDYQFNRYTYKKDIADIYNAIVAEKEALQASYDRETDHSRNKLQQAEWLKKIDELLEGTASSNDYP